VRSMREKTTASLRFTSDSKRSLKGQPPNVRERSDGFE
jgi:hypothetical protein